MDMELTYIYHSGFALSGDGFTVIMDYYRDSEDGQAQSDLNRLMDGTFSNQEAGMPEGIVHSELLRRPGKLYVLASHFHPDHFNKEVLQWREQRPDIIYIFSKDILRHRRAQKEDAVWLKKEVLIRQILLSESVGKPLVIHCVKAFNELIELKKCIGRRCPGWYTVSVII